MKLRHLCQILFGALFAVVAAQAAAPVGHWEGSIQLPGTELGIRVDLTAADAGAIDIPVQGLRGFALGDVSATPEGVSFAMPNIPGNPVFTGTFDESGDRISGTFSQNGQSFPFTLERKSNSSAVEGETPSQGVTGEGLAGHWQGSLQVGPTQLRLVLNVTADGDALTATLDSLDQGANGLPVADLKLDDQAVSFAMPAIGARYVGTLAADGSQIDGKWSQGPGTLPLVFRRLAQAAKLNRPQEPSKPYPYQEQEVTFTGGAPDVTLAGTLTIPEGDGPFPAVVLLTGSGPQDRNETLMGHRPFLVLADHLTRQGIAVLRFDDRGFGASTGNFAAATHQDFANDGESAWAFLRSQPKIDPARVGLLGHSEGGVYAPIIAGREPDVAFIVMLAGVGVPTEELLQRQGDDLMRVSGINAEVRQQQHAIRAQLFDTVRRLGPTEEARAEIRRILGEAVERYTPEQRNAMGMTDGAIEQQVALMANPWFVALLDYDPAEVLPQVQCPVLAVNGEKDLQVAATENLAGIRKGLAAGGNEDVTIQAYPNLNHLFQTAQTGAFNEYGTIEETMSPVALEAVSTWILNRTDSKN